MRFSIALDRPLIGLGASAPVYYPAIAAELGAESAIPPEADVANAVGAVVGQVRVSVTVFVTSPEEGIFVINGGGESRVASRQHEAFDIARVLAEQKALAAAIANGAEEPVVHILEEIDAPEIEGRPNWSRPASSRPPVAAPGRSRLIVSIAEIIFRIFARLTGHRSMTHSAPHHSGSGVRHGNHRKTRSAFRRGAA